MTDDELRQAIDVCERALLAAPVSPKPPSGRVELCDAATLARNVSRGDWVPVHRGYLRLLIDAAKRSPRSRWRRS